MSSRFAFLVPALLLATPAAAQTALPPFACQTFPKDASAASLARTFGAANVKDGEIYVAEGESERGTILFPNDPRRRVEILWFDGAKRSRPNFVRVSEGADWTFRMPGAPDIRVGSPMDAVQQANGKPFAFSGFGWDMGGWANDLKGGRLAAVEGGCMLSLRFEPDGNAKDAALEKVSGDRTLSSSAPAVRAVRPQVSTMGLGWPEK